MKQLLYLEKSRKYYYYDETWPSCDVCHREIANPFILIWYHVQNKTKEVKACPSCAVDINQANLNCAQSKIVIYTNIFIESSIAVVPKIPLMKSTVDLASAAISNKGIESDTSKTVIIDHCRVAFDPDRNIMPGALEHKAKVMQLVAEKDREVKDIDSFLDNALNQKLEIECEGAEQAKKIGYSSQKGRGKSENTAKE